MTILQDRRAVAWLLLDVGGVLERVDDDTWPASFRARWEARLGLDAGELARRLALADLPDAATRSGVVDEYWQRIGAALKISAGEVAAMRADFWDEYCGTADDELLRFLGTLRATVRLAILSNSGDGAREEEERRFGFSALFDPICYSHEIGVTKPDPVSFQIALGQMGAAPGEVLFIDDHRENVEAARRLGFRAHLHLSAADTITAVQSALARG